MQTPGWTSLVSVHPLHPSLSLLSSLPPSHSQPKQLKHSPPRHMVMVKRMDLSEPHALLKILWSLAYVPSSLHLCPLKTTT